MPPIYAQLLHLHFNICVTKKWKGKYFTLVQLLCSLELAMIHDQATDTIWLTPKPLESTVNNTPSKKQPQGLIY